MDSLQDYVNVDCAFGGMWYAIVDIDLNIGLPKIEPENGRKLAKLGEEIKELMKKNHPVQHPELDYAGPDILVFTSDQFK